MRADARRNQERLLDAAAELILEVGGDPGREAVARRAEVGIGTLYRHFPDQRSLLAAVARHVQDRTIAAGEAALDAFEGADALRHYMHVAVDEGLGVLNIVYPLVDRADWPDQRARAEELLSTLVERARLGGRLRDGVTTKDVGFSIMRACRPLAVGISPADERALAHRHVDICLDGMTKAP